MFGSIQGRIKASAHGSAAYVAPHGAGKPLVWHERVEGPYGF
jgi:hypothetical protein